MDCGPGELSTRKVSVTVQLSDSDEYEGGDLEFMRGSTAEQAPRGKGVVVIFPSYMLHRVTPITKGIRKSFVIWLGGSHYR
jgi:PKHD-type hydroxylase